MTRNFQDGEGVKKESFLISRLKCSGSENLGKAPPRWRVETVRKLEELGEVGGLVTCP